MTSNHLKHRAKTLTVLRQTSQGFSGVELSSTSKQLALIA